MNWSSRNFGNCAVPNIASSSHQQRRIRSRCSRARVGMQIEHELRRARAPAAPAPPFSTTNRAPDSFAAVSKSIRPSASPSSNAACGLNASAWRLRPEVVELDVVVLVLAVRHVVERQVRDRGQDVVEFLAEPLRPRPRSAGICSFSVATSAISAAAAASSLAFLAAPISLEAALRRACAASAFWIAARRCSSSAISVARLRLAARAAPAPRRKRPGCRESI